MSTEPLITIVVVTYNAAEHLPLTISSIIEQDSLPSPEIEILLIDGGSTDQTLDIASASELFARIVSEPDHGIYDAMNKGASLATGTWLHFLNAGDAFADSAALGRVIMAISSEPSGKTTWAVSGAQNLRAGKSSPTVIRNLPHVWWKHSLGLQPHCHQATWFKRRTFLESGGYSLNFSTAGDFDLIMRFGLLTIPLQIDEILINYLGGGVSQVSPRQTALLQHAVRSERLMLRRPFVFADRLLSMTISAVNAARIWRGAIAGSLPSVRVLRGRNR